MSREGRQSCKKPRRGMHACRLITDEDGMARNTFWITDRRGNKLSNYHAEMLAERVGDFVVYCTPDQKVPRLIRGGSQDDWHTLRCAPWDLPHMGSAACSQQDQDEQA